MRGIFLAASPCALAIALVAGPAAAQTVEPAVAADTDASVEANNFGIADIVVTARRRAENLQDVPIAISAIAGENLAARGLFKTEDLMGSIPNLQIGSFVGSATPNITLRGIGVGNEFNATANSPIGVYIDEDYQAFRPAHGQQLLDRKSTRLNSRH